MLLLQIRRMKCTIHRVCDYKTINKELLSVHTESEHKEKKITCEDCTFKADTSDLMIKHIRFKHSKQISCDLCEFKSGSSDNVRNHKAEYHKVQLHTCDVCDQTFVNEQLLKTHKEKHTSVQCEFCNYSCNSSEKLDDHMKKKHSSKFL